MDTCKGSRKGPSACQRKPGTYSPSSGTKHIDRVEGVQLSSQVSYPLRHVSNRQANCWSQPETHLDRFSHAGGEIFVYARFKRAEEEWRLRELPASITVLLVLVKHGISALGSSRNVLKSPFLARSPAHKASTWWSMRDERQPYLRRGGQRDGKDALQQRLLQRAGRCSDNTRHQILQHGARTQRLAEARGAELG